MKIQPEQRIALDDKGVFKSFCLRRDELKRSGMSARDSHMQAIREYLGEDWVYSNKTKRVDKRAALLKANTGKDSSEKKIMGKTVPVAKSDWKKGSGGIASGTGVEAGGFIMGGVEGIGKTTEEIIGNFDISKLAEKSKPVEMIQWIMSNLVFDIDFSNCPGRDALSLLIYCKKYPSLAQDFVKVIFPKIIPARATFSDDDAVLEDDGFKAMEVLDKIGEIRKKSEGKAE